MQVTVTYRDGALRIELDESGWKVLERIVRDREFERECQDRETTGEWGDDDEPCNQHGTSTIYGLPFRCTLPKGHVGLHRYVVMSAAEVAQAEGQS